MKIGGIQKLSLVDYPGKTCATIFTINCNFRCRFCHNPELVLPDRCPEEILTDEVLGFLKSRVGKLEGVVISGGEPTLHHDLDDFIKNIKQLGFLVKLDTNGSKPEVLKFLFEEKLLDFVAMDIKTLPRLYGKIMGWEIDPNIIEKSIKLIKTAGIDHEFRTTVVKTLIKPEYFEEIGKLVAGSPRYALQRFRPGLTLDPSYKQETTYDDKEFDEVKACMEKYVSECVIH